MKRVARAITLLFIWLMLVSCGTQTEEVASDYSTSVEVDISQAENSRKESNVSETYDEECEQDDPETEINVNALEPDLSKAPSFTEPSINVNDILEYSETTYAVINNNVPYFTDDELSTESFEYYSELDSLGRCGVCVASIGQDIMPTEERGEIGNVKPTGWHTVKYPEIIDGNYLYNRCHLIGFQLADENANVNNLITGTRYLNMEGMLPFENMVADFVKETGYHVMYRVTPVFEGDNLVADGVLIEAESVEDGGQGISFNVFCYNIQPGITIDYATGNSTEDVSIVAKEEIKPAEETPVLEQAQEVESDVTPDSQSIIVTPNESGAYAVNSKNGKIHITGACAATRNGSNAMKAPVYFGTYEGAEEYSIQIAPSQDKRQCGNCW